MSGGMLSEGVLRQRQERNAAEYGRDTTQSPESFTESRPKRRRVGILRRTEILRGGGMRANWLAKGDAKLKGSGSDSSKVEKDLDAPLATESPRLRRYAPELCA